MKKILDVTCGMRGIWFNKNHPDVIYCDRRKEEYHIETEKGGTKNIVINPDVVCDFTEMPFPDNTFHLVVFDPPHLLRIGENAWMRKKYGKLPEDWPKLIHDGFQECMRVLKPYGTLVFKWSEIDLSTREVIKVIGQEPLFGHRLGKAMKTHWLCFMKLESEVHGDDQ